MSAFQQHHPDIFCDDILITEADRLALRAAAVILNLYQKNIRICLRNDSL